MMMRLLLLLALCLGSFGLAQVGGARLSTCLGAEIGEGFSVQGPLCNVTAFIEAPVPALGQMGVFAQVTPRLGPFYDNWTLYVYRPDTRFDLFGINWTAWPGVAVGRELGDWFVGFRADILITFDFREER